MELKVIEPTMEYADEIMAYRRAFLEAGGSMDGCGKLRRCETAEEWLDFVEQCSHEETVPAGMVPCSQFICVRKADNKLVGMIQIRHYFNEYLEKYAGHIGYSVRPDERRKGYAKFMLKSILPKCRELGIDSVLISCVKGNEGSRRTIIANGGVYESDVYLEENDVTLERYWIDLTDRAGES